jgi:hypothetical protein
VPIDSDGIYVVDCGYVDFPWLWSIHKAAAFFTTRLKKSIKWTRVVSQPDDKSFGLRGDRVILWFTKGLPALYPIWLQRNASRDEAQERTPVFLTNSWD